MDISKSNDLQNFSADGSCQSMVMAVQFHHSLEDISEEEFNAVKLKYGMGSVYFNAARNCYQAAFYIMLNGEKKRKILSAPTMEEAFYAMAFYKNSGMAIVDQKEVAIPTTYHKVADIWEKVMLKREATCKEPTKRWYADIVKPIIRDLGETNIEELTSEDIQNFLNKLRYLDNGKPASDSKIKNTTMQLKAIITYAVDEGYIPKTPFNSNVSRPKGVEHDTRENTFTKEEVIILLNQVKKTASPIIRAVVSCLLLSGLRINELLALKYSDLDRENGVIHIRNSIYINENKERVLGTPKTETSKRTVPVPPIFFDLINNWRLYVQKDPVWVNVIHAKGNDDIIFIGDRGNLRSDDTLRTAYTKAVQSAGLKKPNTSFHGLRHTYATLVQWSGTDLEIVSKLLGHKLDTAHEMGKFGSDVTSKVYVKENVEKTCRLKKEAIERYMAYMGDIFGPSLTNR